MNTPHTIIAFFLLVVTAFSQDLELTRPSYPLTPDDTTHSDAAYTEQSLIPKEGVKSLTDQKTWLKNQLKRFPNHASKSSTPSQKFGFLCPIPSHQPQQAWVDLTLNQNENLSIEGIALIPALYYKHSSISNYGFPKRFKIDAYTLEAPNTPVTIVDWTTKDFPDPGLSPVIFSTSKIRANRVKLTVIKGSTIGENHFFALDELKIFRNDINIAPPLTNQLTTSSTYNIPPYWHLNYLIDGSSHIGPALTTTQDTEDYIQYLDKETLAKQKDNHITVTIDLGKEYSIGRLELYAAHSPHSHIPSIPLPYHYQIELLHSLTPEEIVTTESIKRTSAAQIRYHPLHSHSGRYIRIHFTHFPTHHNRPVLAIGEIRIIGDDGINQGMLELNKKITIHSSAAIELQNNMSNQNAQLLIDSFANGQHITSEKLYIQQLAKKNIVENTLTKVTNQLNIAKALRSQRHSTIGIALISLLILTLILLSARTKRQKEQEMLALQKQIAADLHDDISGNLGTISMISNRLHKLSEDTKAKDKLREIDHLSQESYISIKEIIWHTDSQLVRLSDLLKQITRTARSISSDCNLTFDYQSQYNNLVVPVKMRRNIILLVKEALFNCAKYAKAENILIKAEITHSELTLIMRDDGCGFDSSKGILTSSESGRGLLNMEQRAKLLGANLTIQSTLNVGTEIHLKMPLTNKK